MLNNNSIGIMQGRLSNKLGALQSFPWEDWRQEFLRASSIGFNQIEWLVDGDSVSKNPISTIEGRKEIAKLQATHKVSIKSLCAHIFIDGGLLDSGANYIKAKTNFLKILEYAFEANIEFVIIPLMDEMSIKSNDSKAKFKELLCEVLVNSDIRILLESDLPAIELKAFIKDVGLKNVGIVYDLGNATAMGYDIETELLLLHPYIGEVHIKDRFINNGKSVRLGFADTPFYRAVDVLRKLSWQGPFILETPIFDNWKEEAEVNFLFTKKFVNSAPMENAIL